MAFAPRILLDHSGYDLKNLGDAAQFLGANLRLRERWPHAQIVTIANNLDLLHDIDPRLHGISLVPDAGLWAATSERIRGGVALRYKRLLTSGYPAPRVGEPAAQLVAAMRTCDLALSSGGGFLNNDYPLHAMGVLGLLNQAGKHGAVTAMMGQGIGDFTLPQQVAQAREVLPRLDLLTLRGETSAPRAARYRSGRTILAGDDALNVATALDAEAHTDSVSRGAGKHRAETRAIGFNLRIADYTNVTDDVARQIGAQVREARVELGTYIQPLPISWHLEGEDLRAVQMGLGAGNRDVERGARITTPQSLVDAVSHCRVVVVCSYHAALFSLSQGVPVVGLSSSDYYDSKFADLRGHFGKEMVDVFDLRHTPPHSSLRQRIEDAAQRSDGVRNEARRTARAMSSRVQESYEELFALVEKKLSS